MWANGEAYSGIRMRGIAEVSREAAVPKGTDAFIGSLNSCTEIITQIGNVIAGVPLDVGGYFRRTHWSELENSKSFRPARDWA